MRSPRSPVPFPQFHEVIRVDRRVSGVAATNKNCCGYRCHLNVLALAFRRIVVSSNDELNPAPGTIDFIREGDFSGKPITNFVKIGLTRLDRTPQDRQKDLKTGNPRELYVNRAVPVPFVNDIETALRYEYLPQHIYLEWHEFAPGSERSLDDAIATCESLGKEFNGYINIANESQRLKSVVPNGSAIAASPEAEQWKHEYLLHHEITALQDKAKKFRREAVVAALEQGEKIPAGASVSQSPKNTYDWNNFKLKFPEIYDRNLQPNWNQNFEVTGARLKATKASFQEHMLVTSLSKEISEYQKQLAAVTAETPYDEYSKPHSQWMRILQMSEFSKTRKRIARCHLMALCGEASGIGSVCTWQREPSEPRLDTESIIKKYPDFARQVLVDSTMITTVD